MREGRLLQSEALIDWVPYPDPEDPTQPTYAPISMMGQCEEHGLERITREKVTPGPDPTAYFTFACGKVDLDRF